MLIARNCARIFVTPTPRRACFALRRSRRNAGVSYSRPAPPQFPRGCSTPRRCLTASRTRLSALRIEHLPPRLLRITPFSQKCSASSSHSASPAIPTQRRTSISRVAAARLRKRACLCRGLSISPGARVFAFCLPRRPHGVCGCRPSALLRGKNSPTLRYWKISGSLRMSSCSAFVTAGRLRLQSSASCSCVSCGMPSSWQRLTT